MAAMPRLRWLPLLTCLGVLLGTHAPAHAGTLSSNHVSGFAFESSPLSSPVLTSLVSHVSGCQTPVVGEYNILRQSSASPSIRSRLTEGGEFVEPSVPSLSNWVEDLERKLLREPDEAQGFRTTIPPSPSSAQGGHEIPPGLPVTRLALQPDLVARLLPGRSVLTIAPCLEDPFRPPRPPVS
jgi:hypothetical protein